MGITSLLSNVHNKLGILAFLGILILIILYLLRPKPLKKTIPSLMFVLKEMGKNKQNALFRTFVRELLFLLQLLAVIAIATAATQPFIMTSEDITSENTIIMIDISASMNAKDGFGTRFSRAIDKAKGEIEGKITLITVSDEPKIVLDRGSRGDALDVFGRIKPSHSLSSLGTSILAAGDLLHEKKGKIVVISDFMNTDGIDTFVAKKTLEARDIFVRFIDVKEKAKNIGIVDMELAEHDASVSIQNFNENGKNFTIEVNGVEKKISIAPNWVETITFPHKEGLNTVELKIRDDLELDNKAYISAPIKKPVKILLISNNEKTYLRAMLEAYKESWNKQAKIEFGVPPLLPVIDHDIVIIDDIVPGKLPKADLDKVLSLVKKGSSSVVVAQNDLKELHMDKLLPVTLKIIEGETPLYSTKEIPGITEDVSFGKLKQHWNTTLKKGAVSIARTQNNVSAIAVIDQGKGKLVFFGIMDKASDFRFDVSYPLFWQQLIDYLVGNDDINDLNFNIGERVFFDKQKEIITPSKTIKAKELKFDETGIYEVGNKKFAVNLLNNVESDIVHDPQKIGGMRFGSQRKNIEQEKSITHYFIWLFILFLLLELLYIKIRGDL